MTSMTAAELLDRIRPVERRLPNGLTLLVHEDATEPVVAIVTWVRAGYFDEPDELAGVSHVLEHMFFKGTGRRGAGEIARATKAAGGQLNAGTIYDHTSYYTVLPAAAFDRGLDIQADALLHSRIDADALRKELRVIVEEVKRKLDNPSALAVEKLYATLFDHHPMRRWRMGTEPALLGMTRDDVLGYYRRMYRGPEIVLVVAGDVDADRVADRVEALYGELPGDAAPRPDRHEPDRRGARLREREGDFGHGYIEVGWRTPGTLADDTPALDALATALGQGRAARLYRRVRERGLASAIDAYNYTPTEVGVFRIGLECDPSAAGAALRATWAEVDRVRREPIGGHELERVRTMTDARILRRLETVQGRANLLAEWQAVGDWRLAADHVARLRDLEPEHVSDVARRYLDPDRVAIFAFRPTGAPALAWTEDDVPARLAAGPAGSPEPEPAGAAAPAFAPAPAPEPATRRGVARPAGVAEDGVVLYELEGARLVTWPRAGAALAAMAVVRPGGVLAETAATAGISGLVMRTSLKGTGSRSAERIAAEAERLGGGIAASAAPDLLSWSLSVPTAQLDPALDLLADVALDPVFPDDEMERERRVLRSDLDRLRDDMYHYPMRLMLGAAFEGHPYGHGPDDIARALDGWSADELRRWHARADAEPWVFVVGDIEPDRVADRVAGLVASRVAAARSDPGADPGAGAPGWPDAATARSATRERAQTALALGLPGPPRNHADRIPMQILASAVSGLGNRLFEELRSRRSLAYTVSAFPITRLHAGAFVGYIATSNEQAGRARDGLLEELDRLRREPPTEEELERARESTLGAWRIRRQTGTARLAELAGAMVLGSGLDEIRDYEARVRAVDGGRVLEAARRWLDPDRLAEGVVRGG